MSASASPRITWLVLVAGAISLVVTVLRVAGEMNGWDPRWFDSGAGGRLSPFGIVWLVPVFGFLFGRRLARGGHKPPFVAAFFVPMFAVLVLVAAVGFVGTRYEKDDLREAFQYLLYVCPILSLLGLFAWPRAFLACLYYAVLARLPVCVVQYLDIQNGWQTHYGKVDPKLEPLTTDERLFGLTMAQVAIWIPFTILLGGGCAAIGAATARKR